MIARSINTALFFLIATAGGGAAQPVSADATVVSLHAPPSHCDRTCHYAGFVTISRPGRVQRFGLSAHDGSAPALKLLRRPGGTPPDVLVVQYDGDLTNGGSEYFDPDYFAWDGASGAYRQIRRFQYPQPDGSKFHGTIAGKIVSIDILPYSLRQSSIAGPTVGRVLRVTDDRGVLRLIDYDFGNQWALAKQQLDLHPGDCLAVGRDLNEKPAVHIVSAGSNEGVFTCSK